jgi:hypothetical protein
MIKRALLAVLLLVTLAGCDPVKGPANPAPPPPGNVNQPPGGRGFNLLLQVFAADGLEASRHVDCTIVGYAGGKVVMVDGKPYQNQYNDITTPTILKLIDLATVTSIEYLCTAYGHPGEEFVCTVTKISGGPAQGRFNNLDVIDADSVATCSGTINART